MAARMSGDFDFLESICTPDVVLRLVGDKAEIPNTGVYEGMQAARQAMERVHVEFSFHDMKPEYIMVDGDQIGIRWKGILRNRGTGASANFEGFTHLIFDGDKIKEYFALVDTGSMSRLAQGE